MKKHYRKENNCLNCGTILEGKFCHHCGQENLQIKESFGHMMTHAIADYFHFDHQFFHTLRPLLLKPGKLTNEYMAGRRVQYLHPVKMYIFISIVYFLLLFSGGHGNEHKKETKQEKLTTEQADSVKHAIADIPVLSEEQKKLIAKGVDAKTDTSKKHDKASVKGGHDNSDDEEDEDYDTMLDLGKKKYKTYEEYLAAQEKLPENKRDGFIERYINKKNIAWREGGKDSKKAMIEAFKHNIPKMMFVLLPLFALILKITFYSNHKFYVEHLIFSFHLHCFLFLFLAVIMILQRALPESWGMGDWLGFLAFFVIVWYIYRALRVVYQRRRTRTITKMLGMSFAYLMTFSIVITILFIISALTAI